jgi:hypothetical protein
MRDSTANTVLYLQYIVSRLSAVRTQIQGYYMT